VLAVLAALVTWPAFAGEKSHARPNESAQLSENSGSEDDRAAEVDSGWAVAAPGNGQRSKPAPFAGSHQDPSDRHSTIARGFNDPRQQIILHHVLEQGRTPLLRKMPSVEIHVQEKQNQQSAEVRIAVRPDGIEGWRSPGPVFAPLETPDDAATAAVPADQEPSSDSGEPAQIEQPAEAQELPPETPGPESQAGPPHEVLPETSSSDENLAPSDGLLDTTADDHAAPMQPHGRAAPLPPAAAEEPPPPLPPHLIQLRSRVRSVLKGYYRKTLNSRDHDPWEMMHGMLAYGVHSRLRQGGPRGETITTVGWLCYNKPCKGLSLLYVTPKGELRAKYGVGLQGHLGQFLAMLAQCRVSADYPIRVGKNEFTIRDLIEAEKKTCYPKSELTFKLIALQYYLDLNERWENDHGQEWDIPRLIREELAQPIRGAACGGTHRLSGLSLTVKARARRGEPLDGEYARAAAFVRKYHKYAFSLQNRDGSLSTNWFRGRGDEADINRRIKTTGHILEWLCYSLSDQELRQPQTVRAVSYLANLMYSKYDNEWEVGPMCHAIHALLLYDQRVFEPFDGDELDIVSRPRGPGAAGNQRRGSPR
jgi:hypothetical protein